MFFQTKPEHQSEEARNAVYKEQKFFHRRTPSRYGTLTAETYPAMLERFLTMDALTQTGFEKFLNERKRPNPQIADVALPESSQQPPKQKRKRNPLLPWTPKAKLSKKLREKRRKARRMQEKAE